jgi:hypothetical protein
LPATPIGVGGVRRLAGGRKGFTLQPVPARPSGDAAPSRTFPVLSSAVCVIRGMELWYACTIDGDVRIDKLYLFARIVRQPEGVARTIRATQEGHRRVAPPPGGARTVAVALPRERPSRAAPWRCIRNGAGSLGSFVGRWSGVVPQHAMWEAIG